MQVLLRRSLSSTTANARHKVLPPLFPQPRAIALSTTALGLGMFIGAEPERPAQVRANLEAAVRAGRLAICAVQIAREYKHAKSWAADEPEKLRLLEAQHLEAQLAAGRAERERARAAAGVARAEATEHARRTRDAAVALGEELARERTRATGQGSSLARRWEELHARCAERVLGLCLINGGVYVKLGQHLAQLDYLVPEPYIRVFSPLFEHNATSPADAIARVVEEELGAPIHDIFSSFDPEPVASASLAQVHKAVCKRTGALVAVKVQHPRLREASAADIAAVGLAVKLASYLFPADFRIGFVMDELAPHLPLELDFEHEASNLERCRRFFCEPGGGGRFLGDAIALPRVLPHASSARVLTMSWEEGCRINDTEGLREAGMRPAEVAALLSECFCALIFRAGFCHCDPHPGNVLVRPRLSSPHRPQLVLLDHGLYRCVQNRVLTHA